MKGFAPAADVTSDEPDREDEVFLALFAIFAPTLDDEDDVDGADDGFDGPAVAFDATDLAANFFAGVRACDAVFHAWGGILLIFGLLETKFNASANTKLVSALLLFLRLLSEAMLEGFQDCGEQAVVRRDEEEIEARGASSKNYLR